MLELQLKDVTITYTKKGNETVAVNKANATFVNGINVLIGYSGCGKTTLLKGILGLLDHDGEMLMNGSDLDEIATQDRNFSFVSQEYVLYPNMTVFDNIAFPLKVMRAPKQEIKDRVREIAEALSLTPCLTRKPKHISGGQQQRVALARALVKRPALCLFDEPLSNVDAPTRSATRHMLKSFIHSMGYSAIYVTHDFDEAMAMADNLLVMDKGQIVIQGNPLTVYNSGNSVVNSLKTQKSLDFDSEQGE